MEFTVETIYDQKALTAMARGIRKTIQKKRNKRSRVFGILVSILGLLLAISASEINFQSIVTFLAVAAIVIVLIWEDAINGYFAKKRNLPGLNKAVATFREDGYHSQTDLGSSDFLYTTIQRLVQCGDYLVFVFSISHGQVFDLETLAGGTKEEFLHFLMDKTGKPLETV